VNPQISAILIGVKDLNRSKKFHSDLGCRIDKDYPAFVSFNRGSCELGLYPWDALAQDAGVAADGSGFRGFTFNHVVQSAAQVDELMAQADRAGAGAVKPAQKSPYGYFGYFSDPDGYLWKVASGS
jgi:predicted lactoylglutathione lyase